MLWDPGGCYAARRNSLGVQEENKAFCNFIPTGSSYSLLVRDARGKLPELSNSEQLVNSYLASLAEQTPWVIFGYDGKLEKLYKKHYSPLSKRYLIAGQRCKLPSSKTPETERFLTAQADAFAGANAEEKSACSVRNDDVISERPPTSRMGCPGPSIRGVRD